jgi:hypothetical protein
LQKQYSKPLRRTTVILKKDPKQSRVKTRTGHMAQDNRLYWRNYVSMYGILAIIRSSLKGSDDGVLLETLF